MVSAMTNPLETARLVLQPIEPSDAEQIQIIFPQWAIVRYLASTVPWPYPADGAHAFCREAIAAAECGDGWTWSIRTKVQSDHIIGVIELMNGADNNRGFWLVPAWQGQGLITEACDAVTGSDQSNSPSNEQPNVQVSCRTVRASTPVP